MLGMLVAVSEVGASVRARWMCSVRQSSASSEKYELVVMLVNLYFFYKWLIEDPSILALNPFGLQYYNFFITHNSY